MSIEEIKLIYCGWRGMLPSERIALNLNLDQFPAIPLKFYFHERK
jgi:hypothetical protein